ncbi:MAG: HNH endonuclease [Actinobacteria bacterium]|nr:MAG: HNH endonuclease [Actinomycetota bacterium]
MTPRSAGSSPRPSPSLSTSGGGRRWFPLRCAGPCFPACDRPPPWCDAHHIKHWADGGATALSNLVLLCRRHHRLVHQPGGFRLEMLDGMPLFKSADGSLLEDRAPPNG